MNICMCSCLCACVCKSICASASCARAAQHLGPGKSSSGSLLMHGKSGSSVKRGSECFPHGSQRSQRERVAWKWDELEWEGGARVERGGRDKEKVKTHREHSAVFAAGVGIDSLPTGHEVSGVSFGPPVCLKTMRGCTHDCEQITLRDWERLNKNNLMCQRIHSSSWLLQVCQDQRTVLLEADQGENTQNVCTYIDSDDVHKHSESRHISIFIPHHLLLVDTGLGRYKRIFKPVLYKA